MANIVCLQDIISSSTVSFKSVVVVPRIALVWSTTWFVVRWIWYVLVEYWWYSLDLWIMANMQFRVVLEAEWRADRSMEPRSPRATRVIGKVPDQLGWYLLHSAPSCLANCASRFIHVVSFLFVLLYHCTAHGRYFILSNRMYHYEENPLPRYLGTYLPR